MFSVREPQSYYKAARDKAWESIQDNLSIIKQQLNLSEVYLEGLTCNEDSYLSRVEELPDEPKNSQLDQLQIKVEMIATYRIIE